MSAAGSPASSGLAFSPVASPPVAGTGAGSAVRDRMSHRWTWNKELLWTHQPPLCASLRDGFSQHRLLDAKYKAFLFARRLVKAMEQPDFVLSTAVIMMHRFFVLQSLQHFNYMTVMYACLFLAFKTEERFVRMETLIKWIDNERQLQERPDVKPERIKSTSKEFFLMKEQMEQTELMVLKTLGFDVHIKQPVAAVLGLMHLVLQHKYIEGDREAARSVVRVAKEWILAALGHHDLYLVYDQNDLATAFVYGAALQLGVRLGVSLEARAGDASASAEAAGGEGAAAESAAGGDGNETDMPSTPGEGSTPQPPGSTMSINSAGTSPGLAPNAGSQGAAGGSGSQGRGAPPKHMCWWWPLWGEDAREKAPVEGTLVVILRSFFRYCQARHQPDTETFASNPEMYGMRDPDSYVSEEAKEQAEAGERAKGRAAARRRRGEV